eukprot:1155616-Pelagomonas_calceolata.AAC.10
MQRNRGCRLRSRVLTTWLEVVEASGAGSEAEAVRLQAEEAAWYAMGWWCELFGAQSAGSGVEAVWLESVGTVLGFMA